ncbi:hypothetical protein VTN00DRAFT_2987 [Thermoascus crustaceus]|uniref:uncharacterized protein n=1 Tax=Thermoascus crustaceus TaxID=5088 RepID=UPI003742C694
MSSSLEAKIVVLGAQGVGKTSLVQRYVKNAFEPANITSTVGASFVTKRVLDSTSDTIVRLQIWDTAGQERFRSISRLYYRGANACLLCYDITDEQSFEEMTGWLLELKKNLGEDEPLVIHVVGTKADIVALDPSRRRVPFERTIAYVAEQLYPSQTSTPPATAGLVQSPDSKRSSGFWGQDVGWDCCHEISAKDGEGIEEVFRVITRKLVEQRNKREAESAQRGTTRRREGARSSVESAGNEGTGSFRLGNSDKRRSWLGFPPGLVNDEDESQPQTAKRKARCFC